MRMKPKRTLKITEARYNDRGECVGLKGTYDIDKQILVEELDRYNKLQAARRCKEFTDVSNTLW